jgi:hypothetical protein
MPVKNVLPSSSAPDWFFANLAQDIIKTNTTESITSLFREDVVNAPA